MKPILALAATLVLGLGFVPAHAQTRQNHEVTVSPGETVRLWSWAHFNTDCVSTRLPEYSFSRLPGNGELFLRDEGIAITNVTSDDRAHCIGRTIQGRRVYFTAHANARGSDNFVLYMNRTQNGGREVNVTIRYR